jgi:hypothetical protein
MGIESEGRKDLPLTDEDAENVAGGKAKKSGKASHHLGHPARPTPAGPGTTTTTPAGIGMGPDPDYPNPDGGADNLDV